MSNQHTKNHNDAMTLKSQIQNGRKAEQVVAKTDLIMDNARFDPIPWKQIARTHDGN